MKNSRKMLAATMLVSLMIVGAAAKADSHESKAAEQKPAMVQQYAYPTLGDAVAIPESKEVIQIGGETVKAPCVPTSSTLKPNVEIKSADVPDSPYVYANGKSQPCNIMYKKGCMPCPCSGATYFKDVPNSHWASCAVNSLAEAQVAAGYPDGTFKPSAPVLRSELASLMVSGLDLESASPKSDVMFKDVNAKHWASADVYKALNTGIMAGYTDNTFHPDKAASKAEVVSVIAKALPGEASDADKRSAINQYPAITNMPKWSIKSAAEVVKTGLCKNIPPSAKSKNDTVSRAETASLIANLRKNLGLDNPNKCKVGKYAKSAAVHAMPKSVLKVKFEDKIGARNSQTGDGFVAKTTAPFTVNGTTFPAGSKVTGKVIRVERPEFKDQGFIKIKFCSIENGEQSAKLPKYIYEAKLDGQKNPNVAARFFAMPFTLSGRLVGVAGRGVGTIATVAANGVESIHNGVGNSVTEILSWKPAASARSLGDAGMSLAEGLYDIGKTTVTGIIGLVHETYDEAAYVVTPKGANASSINPSEEATITFIAE